MQEHKNSELNNSCQDMPMRGLKKKSYYLKLQVNTSYRKSESTPPLLESTVGSLLHKSQPDSPATRMRGRQWKEKIREKTNVALLPNFH